MNQHGTLSIFFPIAHVFRSVLQDVSPRSQGCSYKIEDVVRQWPRMAEFLLARNETDGWKLGIGRAGRLNAVA